MVRISSLHPITATFFFVSVVLFSALIQNPIIHFVSFIGAFSYYSVFHDPKHSFKELRLLALLFAFLALLNPLFSHNGATVLFFINTNPITLESLLYGANLGIMLLSVVFWFKCISEVLTEEKLLCIFGRFSSRLALVISMSLRFVPTFKRQANRIENAQKVLGMYSSDSIPDRLKSKARVFSSLVNWAFENAIDTANSMKCRGYGLHGRTGYNRYVFGKRDWLIVLITFAVDVVIFAGMILCEPDYQFYPQISTPVGTLEYALMLGAFAALCALPIICEVKEELAWKYYRSKI